MFSKASFIRVLNGGVVHQWMWMFPKTAASGTCCNFAAFEPYAWIKKGQAYSKFRDLHSWLVSTSRHVCTPQCGAVTRHFLDPMSGTCGIIALYRRFRGGTKGEREGKLG